MPSLTEQNPRRDVERMSHVAHAMRQAGIDALACALPTNVLMLCGYWPVVGTALAVTTGARTVVVAPSDENHLAEGGWADGVLLFEPGSLDSLIKLTDVVAKPLANAAHHLGIATGRIGFESADAVTPTSYIAMHVYGRAMRTLLADALPEATLVPADDMLATLRSVKTPREVQHIATACRIAGDAYASAHEVLRPGAVEVEAAARLAVPLSSREIPRSGGHISVMAGARSADAHGSYAMSAGKRLAPGELVLVHCNSYAAGFWTDVTRTFCLGPPCDRHRRMYDAVFEARAAAIGAIKPGVTGREVDRAARDVLRRRGFGDAFKHPTGHGVGFAAIDHNAMPRLHPASDDVLQVGSVFNIEPAIYLDGQDGMRHCDVVALGENGPIALTPFQCGLDDLILRD
jgi:Xaa-Pro aminopeptidase